MQRTLSHLDVDLNRKMGSDGSNDDDLRNCRKIGVYYFSEWSSVVGVHALD